MLLLLEMKQQIDIWKGDYSHRASLVTQTVKNPSAMQETWIRSLCGEDFLEKGMATPVFWPGEFHGQRSLLGYIPWGCKESDVTEGLTL